jgi:hypothetical protein
MNNEYDFYNSDSTIEEELYILTCNLSMLLKNIKIIEINDEYLMFNIYYNDNTINEFCKLSIKQK